MIAKNQTGSWMVPLRTHRKDPLRVGVYKIHPEINSWGKVHLSPSMKRHRQRHLLDHQVKTSYRYTWGMMT